MNDWTMDFWQVTDALSRAVSPENPTGAPGGGARATLEEGTARYAASKLGVGWKVNPYIHVPAGQTVEIANVEGCGVIEHLWMTMTGKWRYLILRMYWDDCDIPSVECPVADFFAMGWGQYAPLVSAAVCVNPGSSFNCYWPMPFRRRFRVTVENIADEDRILFYQIDYSLRPVPENAGYFHAAFHRVNPLPEKAYFTLLEAEGKGQYVGTYMAWGVHNNGWWGEGEVKFFLDGDTEYPTICGTGTEDYFGGSYNFENQYTHQYESFTTPYAGLCQVIRPDGLYAACTRFGMYRWQLPDPVRFQERIRVTVQAIGWREGGFYLPLRDDLSCVAYWYQDAPSAVHRPVPGREELEVI